MKTAALLVTLTGFLVSCSSTQPPNAGRRGDSTMTLDEKTGLIVGIDGKPLTTEQIKTRQRAALDAPAAKGDSKWERFLAWRRERLADPRYQNLGRAIALGGQQVAAAYSQNAQMYGALAERNLNSSPFVPSYGRAYGRSLYDERVRLHADGFGGARGMDTAGNTYRIKPTGFGGIKIDKNYGESTIRLNSSGRGFDDAGNYYRSRTDAAGNVRVERQ